MRHFAVAALLAALGLAGCAGMPPTSDSRLGPAPALSGGNYTSGGGLSVATDLREVDGMTAVCGAWAQSEQQSILTKHAASRVLQTGTVYIGDERLLTGLTFMKEVPPTADYAGSPATCALTGRAWQPGDGDRQVKVRIPRQIVHREIDDQGGVGFIVYFRPDGPGAGGR
ncbi:hypothetical protein [Roseovarius sp. SYSU LYC5161]|uniref:hypothetical protein n=1 Tax=Roseovarius halophilus (ex Wu et al. 2025) TaxID=3376060 RepID=UPI0028713FAD|nr:hypothetical protein [Roseovarius sp.]